MFSVTNLPPISTFSAKAIPTQDNLIWFPELEIGFYPVPDDSIYDASYFSNYLSYEGSPIEKKLNGSRVALVDKYLSGDDLVLDVGIGSGAFIKSRAANTVGTDINPHGVQWLRQTGKLFDENEHAPVAITFWDVFEHLLDASYFLDVLCPEYIFISAPVYSSAESILSSKHYKKNEHRWYWTSQGLIRLMERAGYKCLEQNDMEVHAGRDSIGSFVFRRK